MEFNPCDDAVIVVCPGVTVVTALTTTYSLPVEMLTLLGTVAMFVPEEVRKTVIFDRAADGSPLLSINDTTTAGYVPPSAGSVGGIIVSARPTAWVGMLDVDEREIGTDWDTKRSVMTPTSIATLAFKLASTVGLQILVFQLLVCRIHMQKSIITVSLL